MPAAPTDPATTSSSPPESEVVVVHPDGGQVLRRVDGRLPRLSFRPEADPAETIRTAWALPVWPLHDAARYGPPGAAVHVQAQVGHPPAGFAWHPQPPPPLPGARPWQRPGWPQATLARLDGVLAGLGRPRTGPVRVVSSHDLNTVWELPTAPGAAYFKASESGREAAVVALLARTQPGLVPPLLGAWPEEGWLLSASGGELLDTVADVGGWTAALGALAAFQQRADAPALAALGCPAWPLAHAGPLVLELLADPAGLRGWGVPEADVAALQAARPRVRALLADLAAHGLPDRPAHGDAHPRNALDGAWARCGSALWFDWSEAASAAHPFMDAGWFLAFALHPRRAALPVRAHPGLEDTLSAAFLQAWDCADAAPLLARSVPLALLHRAAVYDRHFRHWQGTVPGWRPQYVRFYLREAAAELGRWG